MKLIFFQTSLECEFNGSDRQYINQENIDQENSNVQLDGSVIKEIDDVVRKVESPEFKGEVNRVINEVEQEIKDVNDGNSFKKNFVFPQDPIFSIPIFKFKKYNKDINLKVGLFSDDVSQFAFFFADYFIDYFFFKKMFVYRNELVYRNLIENSKEILDLLKKLKLRLQFSDNKNNKDDINSSKNKDIVEKTLELLGCKTNWKDFLFFKSELVKDIFIYFTDADF